MIQETISFKMKDGREVLIRSLQREEAKSCTDAMVEIAESSPYILSTPESFKQRRIESQEAWIQECLKSESAIILAVFFQDQIVGLCNGQSYKDIKRKHRAALGVSVHPHFRGYGLGLKLMETLIENMKKFPGVKIIELDVMDKNVSAIKMYLQ